MKQEDPPKQIFEVFSDLFRQQAHQLIAQGMVEARPKLKPDSDEEDITGFIVAAIQHHLRRRTFRWAKNYAVHNEKPIPGVERSGNDRKCLDLVIEFVALVGRLEYIFEAKPLNYEKTYQRTGNYTDKDEAIGRFLKGEYAEYTARFPEVAMLGYMHTDTAEIWRERLKKAIAIKGTELALRATQRDVTVITKFPMEWVSEHDRKSAPDCPIAIYHLLLHLPLPKASRLKAAPPRRQRTQPQDEGKTGNV